MCSEVLFFFVPVCVHMYKDNYTHTDLANSREFDLWQKSLACHCASMDLTNMGHMWQSPAP